MSSLETRKIEPQSGTTVTLGAAGDTVTAPTGAIVKTNTVKDAGGNTLFTSDGAGTLSSVNSAIAGSMIFISSQTASSSASISFTTGIDSTYDEYLFMFTNINPASDGTHFSFQVNADGQSGYNEGITSNYYITYHDTGDNSSDLGYRGSYDQHNGSAYQSLYYAGGNNADASSAGILHLYDPSNTTYQMQWNSRMQGMDQGEAAKCDFVSGWINTAAAITQIDFKMSSGNINTGIISMYGVN